MIMATDRYKLRNPTKQNLISLGYRYYRTTDDNRSLYIYKFPAYKYKKYTTIECEVVTELNTGYTNINIYEKKNMSAYTPFYSVELRKQYGKDFLNSIENRIVKEFAKLNIIEENNNGWHEYDNYRWVWEM